MTKEVATKQPPTAPIQPLNPNRKYTSFYLVMLILSTVGTSLAMLSLFATVPEVIRAFPFAPGYSIFLAFDALISLISVGALVLLWLKKNPLGIWLKLSTYGALILAYIGQLIFGAPIVKDLIEQSMKDAAIDKQTAEVFSNLGFYGGYIFGFIITITMAILWWFAYKSQQSADEEI
jgi:hypothetical protein